jgi:hypothetical protein
MNEQTKIGKIIFLLFVVGAIIPLLIGLSNVPYSLGQIEKLGLTFFESLTNIESQVPQTLFLLLLCPFLVAIGLKIKRITPSSASIKTQTVKIGLWYIFFIGSSYFLGLTIHFGLYFLVGLLTFPISVILFTVGLAFFRPPTKILIWYSLLPSLIILGWILFDRIKNPLVG